MAPTLAAIQDIVRSAAQVARNRALARRSHDFAASLYFLARNWKPSLLFDFGAASNDTLLAIRETILHYRQVEPHLLLTFYPGYLRGVSYGTWVPVVVLTIIHFDDIVGFSVFSFSICFGHLLNLFQSFLKLSLNRDHAVSVHFICFVYKRFI